MLALMDGLLDQAWSRAQALGVPLALDHWAGSPELAELYERAGFAEVGGFALEHDPPWPGTVRVRRTRVLAAGFTTTAVTASGPAAAPAQRAPQTRTAVRSSVR